MKIILFLTTLVLSVSSWWDTGHLMVARMAQEILMKEDNDTFIATEQILRDIYKATPNDTTEDKHPFVECATFADIIYKPGYLGHYQFFWHFIDQAYLDQGGTEADFPLFKYDHHNVTMAIPEIMMWMKEEEGFQFTFAYRSIMSHLRSPFTQAEGKSMAMRLLIHYMGDIHQPLHNIARVNSNYPAGDRGGNDFMLADKDGINELHAVWDSVGYKYEGYVDLPLNDTFWDILGTRVENLIETYGPTLDQQKDLYELNPSKWAADNKKIAVDVVYKDVKENTVPSDEYIERTRITCERQITIAGHRLAFVLKSLNLKVRSEESKFLQ